jgi:hypothetical protein
MCPWNSYHGETLKGNGLIKNTGKKVERRQEKRFRVQHGAFVMFRPSDTGVGRLIDISMHGLTLDYISSKEPEIQPSELDIFVVNSPFRLHGLPCETITDFVTFTTYDGALSKRRRGVQFGKLTESQETLLIHFIHHHTTGVA